MTSRAFIAGCSGPTLTARESAFFRDAAPWGFILFRRNVEDPAQVRALCDALRETVGRADAPILIDQEGGRVQRLGPPHWPKYPPGSAYGRIPDPVARRELTRLGARLIAHDLRAVGIDVDCVPVLDVPVEGAHDVIGDRAYGRDPGSVAILGRAAAEGLLAGSVLPVIKHIPGHGRAEVDSHASLPVINASREELSRTDFMPFRQLNDMPLAMTAHVLIPDIDPDAPASASPAIIGDVIRREIGFDGFLMCDDLGMGALSGTMEERTRAVLDAGCDVALHCSGNFTEMQAVASATPLLAGQAARRFAAACALITAAQPFDEARAESLMGEVLA
jgi:beta-N-acetylhexosaminidase